MNACMHSVQLLLLQAPTTLEVGRRALLQHRSWNSGSSHSPWAATAAAAAAAIAAAATPTLSGLLSHSPWAAVIPAAIASAATAT